MADFVGLRDSLRNGRIGDGGLELCAALSAALDSAIVAQEWDDEAPVTVIALGGYGREELSPHSDVDVMLLHRLDDPSVAAARLFRPLWDAGMRVGHSVRTVAEADSAARERFDTHTTLLTARFVAGNVAIWDDLISRVALVTRARPLRRHLVAEERDRRRRWPYLVMAPDLKNGRGGLRALQGLEWERRREQLIGRFTAPPEPEEAAAAQTLIRVRNALHVVTDRPHDVFSAELRQPVADWLDGDLREIVQEVTGAMHQVDHLAARHWPEALEDSRPKGPARLISSIKRRTPFKGDGSPPGLAQLMRVLETGQADAWAQLRQSGELTAVVPAWDMVGTRAQLEPFHEHPVGEHLWRTVHEMRRLTEDRGHLGEVAAEVDSPETLYLTAFLHDIGKGQGADHSEAGAVITDGVCSRLGVPPTVATRVQRVVRHHLLLALTATRRDLDDPAVIDQVVELVEDLTTLQTLYLLTVADSRATGPTMWSPWKATLVRTLFTRCASRFGGDRALLAPPERADLASQAPTGMREAVAAHLHAMPDPYVRDNHIEDIVWHLELLSAADGLCEVGVRADSPLESAVVVGPAGGDGRARVGETFAAHGIDVVEARMATRDDGMMVDTFRVRDDRTGGVVPPERWEGVRADLVESLSGGPGAGPRLISRVSSYPDAGVARRAEARAATDPASGVLVITVKCSDRIGRLAEILGVLAELSLPVRLAKLESRGEEVVDTFHVEPGSVRAEDISALGDRIAGMIRP